MKGRITDILEVKNQLSRDLHVELERITSAYGELVGSAANKLQEFSVPLTELGFEPLKAGNLVSWGEIGECGGWGEGAL